MGNVILILSMLTLNPETNERTETIKTFNMPDMETCQSVRLVAQNEIISKKRNKWTLYDMYCKSE